MLLFQFQSLMIDGANLALPSIQFFLLKDPWHVIKLLIKIARKDLYQELLTMPKSMDWLKKRITLIAQLPRLLNNVKNRQKISKNSKFLITVLQKTNKISSNKSSTMVQSLQSSQFIETSLFIRKVSIKYTQETKSSVLDMPSKWLDGMSEMVRTVGLLKILGVKIGEKMVLGNYFHNSRCILTNQEELGLERFTLAVALNSEQI